MPFDAHIKPALSRAGKVAPRFKTNLRQSPLPSTSGLCESERCLRDASLPGYSQFLERQMYQKIYAPRGGVFVHPAAIPGASIFTFLPGFAVGLKLGVQSERFVANSSAVAKKAGRDNGMIFF